MFFVLRAKKRKADEKLENQSMFCTQPNFFAAGRCISLIGDAWEITRCIPCSGLTEEAAGNAAALFGTGKREKLCGNVQKSMTANGNILHWEEE